jgi:accessory gene regulator B
MLSVLSKKIADSVVGSSEANSIRYLKVKYISEVLLSEFLKLTILGAVFVICKCGFECLFCIFVLTFTRRYIGGLHAKSFWGCTCLSLICVFFSLAVFYNTEPFIILLVYLIWMLYVKIFGVVESANRIKSDEKKIAREKAKAMYFTGALFLLLRIFSLKYLRISAGILLFQLIGIIIEEVLKKWNKRKN